MDATIMTAAGAYQPDNAIDDLLASRHFAYADNFDPSVSRDEGGTATLTYRTDAETIPGWRDRARSYGAEYMNAGDWAGETGTGFIYDFEHDAPCPLVEMVWRVGPTDAVVASASAVLVLCREPLLVDELAEALERMDIAGPDHLIAFTGALLEGPTLLVRGLEVVAEQQGRGVALALVRRMVEDVASECGGVMPVVIGDADELSPIDDTASGFADAMASAFAALDGSRMVIAEDGEGYLDEIDWRRGLDSDTTTALRSHGDGEPFIPTAAALRIWAAASRGGLATPVDTGSTDFSVEVAIKAGSAAKTTEERADARRGLVGLAMFVALDQRKGWRAHADALLDAVQSLDARITVAQRFEDRRSDPAFEPPGKDLVEAVVNRSMANSVDAIKHGMRAGHVLDAMMSEVAAESIGALACGRHEAGELSPTLIQMATLVAERLAETAVTQSA